MKKIILSVLISLSFVPQLLAERVRGYTRRDGTRVESYERSKADGNPYNNYNYPGNYNPNKQETTGGSSDAYLKDYYSKDKGNESRSSNRSGYWKTRQSKDED